MTLGGVFGFVALALAFAAAAFRTRDLFFALMTFVMIANAAVLVVRDGLHLDIFVANADGYANVLGAVLGALVAFVLCGLPQSIHDRFVYGPYLRERLFERAIFGARKPFVEASRTLDDSLEERARWRSKVTARPPSPAWASLVDRLARSDQEWAEGVRSAPGDTQWVDWKERNDQIGEEWTSIRGPSVERERMRGRVILAAGWTLAILGIASIGVGYLGVPSAYASLPPQGRAVMVPERPFGHGITLVPMGGVSVDDLIELAQFYGARYELPVAVVPAVPIPTAAFDPARGQLIGEELIVGLRIAVPQAAFVDNQVVIGVVDRDMYVRMRPEWRFAYGEWALNIGVISTGRMGSSFDWFDHAVERARLRKMVTRYIGFMLYGLPESADRGSVLYQPLLSRDDLDLMGEDYR